MKWSSTIPLTLRRLHPASLSRNEEGAVIPTNELTRDQNFRATGPTAEEFARMKKEFDRKHRFDLLWYWLRFLYIFATVGVCFAAIIMVIVVFGG